jgi:TonB family protein
MKKQILSVISIILFGVSIASAQTLPAPVKTISGGVVNGKALSLGKPAYPAAARAVNAEGAVNVQIEIDEEGNVVSANAVSGHPLLREAAREAALQSKFKPTLLSGQAVKVTGVLVYNFVADAMPSWFKVGYDLASVQHAPSLIFLNTNSIGKVFQTDWTTEKEQLQKLAEIKQVETTNVSQPIVTSERKISESTEKRSDGTTVKKVITEQAIKSDNQDEPERTAISQSLIAALQSRLGSDETNLWQFNTGLSLSWAVSKLRYTNERQRVLDSLRQQIQSAPDKISAEYVAEIQKILAILEKPNPTTEDRQQIGQIMSKLFKGQ